MYYATLAVITHLVVRINNDTIICKNLHTYSDFYADIFDKLYEIIFYFSST